MSAVREDIRDFLRREPAAILVEVTGAAGSTPRDTDAWMLVSERAIFATIGGGQLEYMAIDQARRAIRSGLSAEPVSSVANALMLLRDTWDPAEVPPRILIGGSLYLAGTVLAENGTPPE